MNGINASDMKMLTTIIFWALHYDQVTPQLMMLHFNCKEEFAEASLVALHSIGIINKSNPGDAKEPWLVMYHEITDIPNDLLNVLQMNGYTIVQISEALKGLPKEKKKVSSNILTDKAHKWVSVADEFPEENKKCLIRFYDPEKIYLESRTEIVYLEDIKVASYDGDKWTIDGPFPLYDFSPCSKNETINDGCLVTHWANATEKELEQWEHRFDPHHQYTNFSISIDDDKIESIYRALILAGSCISKEAIQYPSDTDVRIKLEEAYKYICDLQTVMDRGGDINAVDN